jgi:hypothetical protein
MRPCFFRLSGGRGGDADRVAEPAFFQAEAEGCRIIATAAGNNERIVGTFWPRHAIMPRASYQFFT